MCNKTIIGLALRNCSNSGIGIRSVNYYQQVTGLYYGLTSVLPNLQNSGKPQTQKPFLPRQSLPFIQKNTPFSSTNNFRHQYGFGGHIFINHYCTENKQKLPKLMDFPEVTWPSVFKTIRNWVLANFIIMRYFDNEFNLADFVSGSKKAVEVVSGLISKGEVNSLQGLVSPEVISQVKTKLSSFSLKQRQELAITAEDIYFCFPYEVGVMFPNEDKDEGENQSRFVEITMCYHALAGLNELREQGITPPLNMGVLPEYRDRIYICNYRFIREFTKGVQDDWTINAINHFKPSENQD